MNPLEEILERIRIARASGIKTVSMDIEMVESLLVSYIMLDKRIADLEDAHSRLTGAYDYAKGM